MDQTYETRRRSGKKNGGLEPKKPEYRTGASEVQDLALETKSRMEKNMSKKKAAPKQTPQTPTVEPPKNPAPQTQSRVSEGEYKGRPVLSLHRHADDKSPLTFGLVKAGLILAHLPEIKAFQDKHGKQEATAAA